MKYFIPFFPLWSFLNLTLKLGGISFSKLPHWLLFFFRFILFEPIRYLELILFYRRITQHCLHEDPIFIIGHWRSGTTYLQHLLSLDNQFITPNLYSMVFADHYMLTARWCIVPLNKIIQILKLSYPLQRMKLDLRLPGEMDPALCAIGSHAAYTWGHLFPKKYQAWFKEHFDKNKQTCNLDDYTFLIKKLSYYSNNKRVIVKSPGDALRIPTIKKHFPNAAFIFIERNTTEVFLSSQYLWMLILNRYSFQGIEKEKTIENFHFTYPLIAMAISKEKHESKGVTIYLSDLQNHPHECIKKIYNQLQLGTYSVPENLLQNIVRKPKQDQQNHTELTNELKSRYGQYYID